MNALPEQLLTVHDVARFARCSKSWVYKQVEAGLLPHIRIGSMIRFDMAAVKAFFAAAASMGNAAP